MREKTCMRVAGEEHRQAESGLNKMYIYSMRVILIATFLFCATAGMRKLFS
jgi:hypothetical protein